MDSDLERIKRELMESYEDGRSIDIAEWTTRFPGHRDELIDFWVWLSETPRLDTVDKTASPRAFDNVAQEAVRQACLAISLGPQWLDEPADPDASAESDLGAELVQMRATPYRFQGRASIEFRRAVVYAWIVRELGARREVVTRLSVQKVAYLLENSLGLGLFTQHTQKPLGPYDHKARYRDAEPIGTRSGWIWVEGARLKPRGTGTQLLQYVGRYVRSQSLAEKLVERLAQLADQELETWATLVWVGHALKASGQAVTADSVQSFLASTPKWRGKLDRDGFATDRIDSALTRLARLRLVIR